MLGLADVIVDLVETGRTLQENGLKVVEVITESTGRLVVNRASYQLKADEIGRLTNAIERACSGSHRKVIRIIERTDRAAPSRVLFRVSESDL
mgnify:CR=1 FL=1